MHDPARRALAARSEADRRRISLCAACEGLLLTAAGLPLPTIRDEDGELIDGEVRLDMPPDKILGVVRTAVGGAGEHATRSVVGVLRHGPHNADRTH
ncbi:MAG: hypothetical protein JOY66_17910 [Acetobacteraceae bacterium]|nr:hypothetical protein [Acetobacteraceae bacterium]